MFKGSEKPEVEGGMKRAGVVCMCVVVVCVCVVVGGWGGGSGPVCLKIEVVRPIRKPGASVLWEGRRELRRSIGFSFDSLQKHNGRPIMPSAATSTGFESSAIICLFRACIDVIRQQWEIKSRPVSTAPLFASRRSFSTLLKFVSQSQWPWRSIDSTLYARQRAVAVERDNASGFLALVFARTLDTPN
jgi:hypothetical protein